MITSKSVKIKIITFLLLVGFSISCSKNSEEIVEEIEEVEGEAFVATGAPSSFTTKVTLMDFTGAWCGYCPKADKFIHEIANDDPKVIPISYHVSDDMANSDSETIDEFLGEKGYPDVLVNGIEEWNYSGGTAEYSVFDIFPLYLNKKVPLGLGISTSVENSKISLTVKVGYSADPEKKIKLAIYLLEDGYVHEQVNYFGDENGQPDPWVDYVHDNILRKSFTKPLGDDIATNKIGVGGIFTKTILDVDMPSTVDNTNNLSVVALVLDENYKAINIQKVKLGSTKDFD